MANKHVKIDFKTFVLLIRYFCMDEHTNELYEQIKAYLNDKTDKLYRHELYSKSKTADNEQERELNRQKYLDEVGMKDSFRY